MIYLCMARGAAAGLLAGCVTGLLALAFAEPSIDAAIALEEAGIQSDAGDAAVSPPLHAHPHVAAHGEGETHSHSHAGVTFSRPVQKAGLVAGLTLYGLGLGAVFGLAFAWTQGRLHGDAWTRALKLGAAAALALTLLPALKYPPQPPAVGVAGDVGVRTAWFLGLGAFAAVALALAWCGQRWLVERTWCPINAQLIAAFGVLALFTVALSTWPSAAGAGGFPADLLWSFRIASLGAQLMLWAILAVLYGRFASWEERADANTRIPYTAERRSREI